MSDVTRDAGASRIAFRNYVPAVHWLLAAAVLGFMGWSTYGQLIADDIVAVTRVNGWLIAGGWLLAVGYAGYAATWPCVVVTITGTSVATWECFLWGAREGTYGVGDVAVVLECVGTDRTNSTASNPTEDVY